MTERVSLRAGWCPGALRPMAAGDGLIVRVKPRGGELSVAQAAGLADLAERLGNGLFDLTGRANLQLRGVSEATLPALIEKLDGLGLLDETAETEAARNIVASPLGGYDPTARVDGRHLVAALEHALVDIPVFRRLPAKFAWVIDEGGSMPLDDVSADIRFAAVAGTGQPMLSIALADKKAVAFCRPDEVSDVAARLATSFLDLCAAHGLEPHRLRDLVPIVPGAEIVRAAGLEPQTSEADPAGPRPRAAVVGLHEFDNACWLGVALPFGRLRSHDLRTLAAAGRALRLTPWRSVMLPGLSRNEAEQLRDALAADDAFILDPDDPRLAIAACVGAPACHRATTNVRRDAARLATVLGRSREAGTRLHVSGCAKGCAHPAVAALTLIGRDGTYDLVRAGTASSAPEKSGLSIEAVAAMVADPELEPAC